MDVYARVVNNEIVEYPVYELHIKNRAHPKEWYSLVVHETKPKLGDYQYLGQYIDLVNGVPTIRYKVIDMDLMMAIMRLNPPNFLIPDQDNQPEQTEVNTTIKEIKDKKLFNHFTKLLAEHAQSRLDYFAKQKGYNDMLTLTSYMSSTSEEFVNDAKYGIKLRDEVWIAIYSYITKLTALELPLPKNLNDINAIMPLLIWPNIPDVILEQQKVFIENSENEHLIGGKGYTTITSEESTVKEIVTEEATVSEEITTTAP